MTEPMKTAAQLLAERRAKGLTAADLPRDPGVYAEDLQRHIYPIESERHALLAGMVWGVASKYGLTLTPEVDEEGNWAASAILELPSPAEGISVRIVVVAPEEES